MYIYYFWTVTDFSSNKYRGPNGHRNSWYQREIYSEDPDSETQTHNPSITNPVL